MYSFCLEGIFLTDVEILGHRGVITKCGFDLKCLGANTGLYRTWKELAFRVVLLPPPHPPPRIKDNCFKAN